MTGLVSMLIEKSGCWEENQSPMLLPSFNFLDITNPYRTGSKKEHDPCSGAK
jgi:hypothetical protein